MYLYIHKYIYIYVYIFIHKYICIYIFTLKANRPLAVLLLHKRLRGSMETIRRDESVSLRCHRRRRHHHHHHHPLLIPQQAAALTWEALAGQVSERPEDVTHQRRAAGAGLGDGGEDLLHEALEVLLQRSTGRERRRRRRRRTLRNHSPCWPRRCLLPSASRGRSHMFCWSHKSVKDYRKPRESRAGVPKLFPERVT